MLIKKTNKSEKKEKKKREEKKCITWYEKTGVFIF